MLSRWSFEAIKEGASLTWGREYTPDFLETHTLKEVFYNI